MLPFPAPFLKVYVDEVVTAIPKDRMDQKLKTFNRVNNIIEFTMKVENNGTLPFLDMNSIRNENGSIVTNWYVKPTSSGRCINYNSNHPMSLKIGIIKGLLFRAMTLSSKKFYIKNTERIELILKNNNYPTSLIHIVFIKINSIFTKLKDKVDKLEQSNLVYKLHCVWDKCYIGQTKQKLKKRLEQHTNDCKSTNAQKSNITALAEHHFIRGHKFKFDETDILDKEDNCLVACAIEYLCALAVKVKFAVKCAGSASCVVEPAVAVAWLDDSECAGGSAFAVDYVLAVAITVARQLLLNVQCSCNGYCICSLICSSSCNYYCVCSLICSSSFPVFDLGQAAYVLAVAIKVSVAVKVACSIPVASAVQACAVAVHEDDLSQTAYVVAVAIKVPVAVAV
ncbi:hypothetical protein M0804_013307 [Polistes exclamans]|nr:hypothetical protein M0804_013307 [Polistes exclamans]